MSNFFIVVALFICSDGLVSFRERGLVSVVIVVDRFLFSDGGMGSSLVVVFLFQRLEAVEVFFILCVFVRCFLFRCGLDHNYCILPLTTINGIFFWFDIMSCHVMTTLFPNKHMHTCRWIDTRNRRPVYHRPMYQKWDWNVKKKGITYIHHRLW